ncbi:MAG: bifunctional metallophosphatase/5'-nucleotidase [Bacteroidales bacterium]|nr:bifunctional metallophosphatase/5'-nucleotidase [Bacteroidales bacterium]
MNYRKLLLAAALILPLSCSHKLKDGDYTLTVLSTNDVHSTWFDSTYVGNGIKKSIFAMNYYIDSVRVADGAENVLLVDAGDCLQGDNAAYYYNYVDTVTPHLFPRLIEYMGYDAIAMGNHDIETGHPVYDRVQADLTRAEAPFLAGNAIRNDSGKPYFPLYKVVNKAGLRIAIIGYNNANISAWLAEEVWSGMHFVSIAQIIQRDVDYVLAKEKPDVMIAAMHSGCGQGDGSILECEALDAFNSVRGVDWLICGHDHRPYVETRDSSALLNSGSHSRYVAHGKMHLTVEGGKIVAKRFETDLIPVKAEKADPVMRAHFQKDFEAVRAFTLQEVGILNVDMRTRDSYIGPCPYMNLIHTLCIGQEPAQLSIAAPLTYNGSISAGTLIFNDLFTIYPFENQLYVITMSGQEVKEYLEASYDRWINTYTGPGSHVLKIAPRDNLRWQQARWSFEGLPYNFDSVAGLNYTVDITKPRGERIAISSLADGSPFDPARVFNVALTSYRASGGGSLLDEVGIDTGKIDERVVARYPEIRSLLYDYLKENGSIDPEVIGRPSVIGTWSFAPAAIAAPALKADMQLLFGQDAK